MTDDPNVVYALDGQDNRLFPYTLVPGLSAELKTRLIDKMNKCCLSETGRDTLKQAAETGHVFQLYAENGGGRLVQVAGNHGFL